MSPDKENWWITKIENYFSRENLQININFDQKEIFEINPINYSTNDKRLVI